MGKPIKVWKQPTKAEREKHMKALALRVCSDILPVTEETSGKRPFGNSGVSGDVLDIIGVVFADEVYESEDYGEEATRPAHKYADDLYDQVGDWMAKVIRRRS